MNRLPRVLSSRIGLAIKQQNYCVNVASRKIVTNRAGFRLSKVNFSTQVKVNTELPVFRTSEIDPSKHRDIQHGMFYTIPRDMANRLFLLGGFDKEQQAMFEVFQETAVMIRQPALEIIDYLKRTDFTRPPNRYVLYGGIGTGKTFILNHLLHYGYNNHFVLLFCPKPTDWLRYPQEYSASANNPKRIDTPLDSALWLQHFKTINHNLLTELNLTSFNKYTWSQREFTNPGDSLLAIVDHGINRIKHASDVVAVLLKELKLHSAKRNCRLMLVVDKINAFYEETLLHFPDRTQVQADDVTIARAFKKFFSQSWQNGALVGSVDKKIVVPYRILPITGPLKKKKPSDQLYKHYGPFKVDHLSDYPKDLLTDIGFQHFDPFVPIEVSPFTDKEANNFLDYYQERNWLQHPEAKTEDGRQEIKFLSAFNPYEMYKFCTNL